MKEIIYVIILISYLHDITLKENKWYAHKKEIGRGGPICKVFYNARYWGIL